MTKITINTKYPKGVITHMIEHHAWDLSIDDMIEEVIKPLLRAMYGKVADDYFDEGDET